MLTISLSSCQLYHYHYVDDIIIMSTISLSSCHPYHYHHIMCIISVMLIIYLSSCKPYQYHHVDHTIIIMSIISLSSCQLCHYYHVDHVIVTMATISLSSCWPSCFFVFCGGWLLHRVSLMPRLLPWLESWRPLSTSWHPMLLLGFCLRFSTSRLTVFGVARFCLQ